MDKPHSFAGKIVKKHGRKSFNDFNQPTKFFAEMNECLNKLDEIPFNAIEDLKKYELNRDVIINIVNKCLTILDAANVNIENELDRMNADPFEDHEEDINIRRSLEIKN